MNIHVPCQYVTTNGVTIVNEIIVSLTFNNRFVQRFGDMIQLYVNVCGSSSKSSNLSILVRIFSKKLLVIKLFNNYLFFYLVEFIHYFCTTFHTIEKRSEARSTFSQNQMITEKATNHK